MTVGIESDVSAESHNWTNFVSRGAHWQLGYSGLFKTPASVPVDIPPPPRRRGCVATRVLSSRTRELGSWPQTEAGRLFSVFTVVCPTIP